MRIADEALVRAKRDRRGSVACASPDDATQLLRTAAIVRAFDSDAAATLPLQGTNAYFQPILALGCTPRDACALIAFEALARWSHPSIGVTPPGELFAAIGPERAAELGQVVREQALATLVSLRRNGLADVRLALNLSASEVCRADIAHHIAEQVERAGLSLRDIDVEITEEVLLDRVSDRTLDQLAALRGRGARLILDDFGTGNSGLAQLLRLPLDGVKLDKQFIQKLGVDTRADEIVQATISLCHGLGLEVVAEGVETEPQATMLRSLDCDAVQGFLYARAMSRDELNVWLHATRVYVGNGEAVGCGRGQRCGHRGNM
jgi:EAL domain-containing protein (putative c-di-GMP-specific phosphodiesterase class I)